MFENVHECKLTLVDEFVVYINTKCVSGCGDGGGGASAGAAATRVLAR